VIISGPALSNGENKKSKMIIIRKQIPAIIKNKLVKKGIFLRIPTLKDDEVSIVIAANEKVFATAGQ
jgi:hypothetical protein